MIKKLLITYFFGCVFFFGLFSSGFVDSLDGFEYLATARRMYYDHTFELPKETLANNQNIWLTPLPGKDGKIYSPTGLGFSIALLPTVAFEDLFLHLAKLKPLSAFPLQSDWPVLLFASWTNSVFGALLAVVVFLYLKTYKLSNKQALIISFVTLTGTNLFVYTKHVMAHMMFIAFLTSSFYFLKRYALSKKATYIFFAAISFGITAITYNGSYIFSIPALIVYYLLLTRQNLKFKRIKIILRDTVLALLGFFPFFLLIKWFNFVRLGGSSASSVAETAVGAVKGLLPPAYILFEGLWNVLISPGRGFFVYSPIIILIFLFWFKLKKDLLPEIISFTLLFLTYAFIISTLRHGVDYPVWHGEYSWGPRYMAAVIPFLMILVGNIFKEMTRLQKYAVFLPLAALGLFIEIIGILLPYQIKFKGLESEFYLNGNYFNVAVYSNIIPRYSAPFVMTKKLIKRIINIPKIYNHGLYNLKLYDGFEYPFDLGYTKWRAIRPLAKMSFSNAKDNISEISFQIKNQKIDKTGTSPATVEVYYQDKKLSSLTIPADKEGVVNINLNGVNANNHIYDLTLASSIGKLSWEQVKGKHVLFLEGVKINGQPQNIETLDYPYYSPVSEKLLGSKYYYWGGSNKNFYDLWDVHSGVFEQTFDLWWLRPFHYWDFPKKLFMALFIFDTTMCLFFFCKTLKNREWQN